MSSRISRNGLALAQNGFRRKREPRAAAQGRRIPGARLRGCVAPGLAAPCALLLLSGCGGAASDGGVGATASPVEAVKRWIAGAGDTRDTLPCAMQAGKPLDRQCRIETWSDAQGRVLMVSGPDGGFRRFRVARDGTVSAADGADAVRAAQDATYILLGIDGERYAVPRAALGNGAAP